MSSLGLLNTVSYKTLTYKPALDIWTLNKETINLRFFVVYLQSLMTGWVYFAPGAAPDWQWDEAQGKAGKPPSSDHKRGFSIEVETEEQGAMTWSGAGFGQCTAVEELFKQIFALKEHYPDKIPLVEYVGSEVKKVGKGSTRIPVFNIVDWVDPAFPPWAPQAELTDAPF
jgi:hypothetical protein